jgi:hypothetical protein
MNEELFNPQFVIEQKLPHKPFSGILSTGEINNVD